MIVYIIIGLVCFGFFSIMCYKCCKNDESSDDQLVSNVIRRHRADLERHQTNHQTSSMDSPPETAAPMQVPFQQSNPPPPMHPPTMQSYQGPPRNVPPLPTSNPPPPIAGTNQFCPPPDLPPPPPYAESTWN